MTLKGRHWTVFWLLLFLGVAFVVVGRQKAALEAARHLDALRKTRVTLEARRLELEQEIREQSSSSVLGPRVERSLGLRPGESSDWTMLNLTPAGPR